MGADFLLALCRLPLVPLNSLVEITKRRVEELSEDLLLAVFDQWGALFDEEDNLEDPEGKQAQIASAKRRLIAAAERISNPKLRDLLVFKLRGERYVFSGGPSWGDSPTESFDSVNMLAEAEIFEEDRDWIFHCSNCGNAFSHEQALLNNRGALHCPGCASGKVSRKERI